MSSKDLQKNILDLEYRFELQKINAILIFCTVGILAFVGSFIWYRERLSFGLGILAFVIIVSIFFYILTRRRINFILRNIRNL